MADLEDKPYDPEREAWTRRRFLKAAGLVAAGAAAVPILEACGGGGGGGGGALTTGKAPVPRQGASIRLLQWVHFVPAADTEFIRQCTEFGTKYGVTVAVERITADQLIAKTAADVESNSGPDIIQMQYGWPHLYDAACVDVSNEVGILKSKLGAVASVNDAFCKVNGVYKAIPYTIVPNAFTYRTDLLSQAGVTSWPKTWTEFAAAAAKMKAANLQPFAQTDGHAYGDSLTMWNPVLWSHGATEVKADGKTVTINSKETRAAIAWAQNAVKGGFVVHPEWLDPDNNQAYHANRISATLNGASIYIREKIACSRDSASFTALSVSPLAIALANMSATMYCCCDWAVCLLGVAGQPGHLPVATTSWNAFIFGSLVQTGSLSKAAKGPAL